ncbi:uncharacterized protein isoform X3 [Leptinotarsa decemlineata]|uniref:uncharacterized protein isoform X3 n=1 Tax=Leptinotarsa decemlineata TaxID=7539 RepID=UPI003D30C7B0
MAEMFSRGYKIMMKARVSDDEKNSVGPQRYGKVPSEFWAQKKTPIGFVINRCLQY